MSRILGAARPQTVLLCGLTLIGCGVTETEDIVIVPVPTVTEITPSSVTVGTSDIDLVVSGSDFAEGIVGLWDGEPRPTAWRSESEVRVSLPAVDMSTPRIGILTLLNPKPGGGASVPRSVIVAIPVATIDSITPGSVLGLLTAGAPVEVFGSGFVDTNGGSRVAIEEVSVPTTFHDPSRLTAHVPDYLLRAGGQLDLVVRNPAPGGGASQPVTITVDNPLPGLTSVHPDTVAVYDSPTLTVEGVGFAPGATVVVDGTEIPTTYVDASRLTAAVPAGLVSRSGGRILVHNPGPGGGGSGAEQVTVSEHRPGIFQINPKATLQGTASFDVTINGRRLAPDAAVTMDGEVLPVVSFWEDWPFAAVTVRVDGSVLNSVGLKSVTLTNPRGGGTAAQTLGFHVLDPAGGLTYLFDVDYPTSDVVYSSSQDRFIAAIPLCQGQAHHPCYGFSDLPGYISRYTTINPHTGTFEAVSTSVIGPRRVALSPDELSLFTNGKSYVHLWDATESPVSLLDSYSSPFGTEDISALPSDPQSFAVGGNSLTIFDPSGPRPLVADGQFLSITASATHVFGYDRGSGDRLYRATITPEGAVLDTTAVGVITLDAEISYSSGKLYASSGEVIDATTLAQIGTLPFSGPLYVGESENRVYVLDGLRIRVIDATSLLLLHTLEMPAFQVSGIPFPVSGPRRIRRWGSDGLVLSDSRWLRVMRSSHVPG